MKETVIGRTWMWMIGAAVAGATLIGSSALLSAQTPTPQQDTDTDRTYAEFLADELDVTVDELREAEANARDAYFDSLVDRGELTQQEAASLKAMLPGQAIAAIIGEPDFDVVESAIMMRIAEIMEMDVQELRGELDDGRNLRQIAEDQNLDVDEVRNELEDTVDEIVTNIQQAGLIHQNDAERLRAQIEQVIDRAFEDNGVNGVDDNDFFDDDDDNDLDLDDDDNDVATPVVPAPGTN